MHPKLETPFTLVVVANSWDILTTLPVIDYEGNPVIIFIYQNFGLLGFVAAKIIGLSIFYLILNRHEKYCPGKTKWIEISAWFSALITAGVCAWNLYGWYVLGII